MQKTVILCSLVALSTSNWLIMWLIIEITSLAFIPNMISKGMKNGMALWKMFVVQSVSSSLMMMSIIMMNKSGWEYMNSSLYQLIMVIALSMKMGMPPFHAWTFYMSEIMDWYSFYLLNTYMKIPPLVCTSFSQEPYWMWYIMIIMSAMFSIMCWNDYSMRRLLLFSSMLNLSWMISSILNSKYLICEYMIIYIILMSQICKKMENEAIHSMASYLCSNSLSSNTLLIFNMFVLAGFPPFAMFMVKLELASWMGMSLLTFTLLIFSSIFMFMYSFITFISTISMKTDLQATRTDVALPLIHLAWVFMLILYFKYWIKVQKKVMLLSWMIMTTIIALMFLAINSFFTSNEFVYSSNEPFECGMEMEMKKSSFGIQFFMLGILFLIFDVEVIIIVPMAFSHMSMSVFYLAWILITIILTGGFLMEVMMGSMDWKEFLSLLCTIKQ